MTSRPDNLMLNPMVKVLKRQQGVLKFPQDTVSLAAPAVSASQLAQRLQSSVGRSVSLTDDAQHAMIRMQLVPALAWADELGPEQRVEAHEIIIAADGISVNAIHPHGLLRAVATLGQLIRQHDVSEGLPCVWIQDWPMFRHRCAADMLVNVEVNRWGCDRGDGRDAFVARVLRKLDFCFDQKINAVWFDGFGWDTNRFPGYAELMRQCNDAALERGIQLTFAGYGGGYGTAYQAGEIYRSGYFGKVYRNQTETEDKQEYACRGMPDPKSRYYGTCLSNETLRAAKLEEMVKFASEIRPGCMYIHDIDVATWAETSESWLLRCDGCRKRWPSDELDNPQGQAGACASWFKQIRQTLDAIPAIGDYLPSRDLSLIFASPLYTHYRERSDAIWEREMHYFETLGQQIGKLSGISFAIREQFDDAAGNKRFAQLRKRMDTNGCNHGVRALVFGGGDTFRSDDLTNTVGATSHFYEGALGVYLSSTGIHSDPVQMLNAESLWSGSVHGYKDSPPKGTPTETWFDQICLGTRKPPEIFAAGDSRASTFEQLCVQRWGTQAGPLMSQAMQSRHQGRLPISHIWWSITNPVQAMHDQTIFAFYHFHEKDWRCRIEATDAALTLARQAASLSDDEDIHWFARCLDLGKRFAMVIEQVIRVATGRSVAGDTTLRSMIGELRRIIETEFPHDPVDILGGDPGCWLPTLDTLEQLADHHEKQKQTNTTVASDFLDTWQVGETRREWPGALCSLKDEFAQSSNVDLSGTFNCMQDASLSLLLMYESPVRVSVDGQEIWSDLDVSKRKQLESPMKHLAAQIPWNATAGRHVVTLHCQPNAKGLGGISARFLSHQDNQELLPQAVDHEAVDHE